MREYVLEATNERDVSFTGELVKTVRGTDYWVHIYKTKGGSVVLHSFGVDLETGELSDVQQKRVLHAPTAASLPSIMRFSDPAKLVYKELGVDFTRRIN